MRYGAAAPARDREEITAALFTRWYRLRKLTLVPALLQEGSQVWTFTNPMDPWGSRERLSIEQLTRMVEQAEAQQRKPITSEVGELPEVRDVAI